MTMYSPDISVVIPISERHDDIRKLYNIYARELTNLGKSFEFIFITYIEYIFIRIYKGYV